MKVSEFFRGLLAAGVLIAAAATAEAQVAGADVDPRTVAELKAEFDRATQLGIPVEPLVAQARKGYLYQVPARRIRETVRATADRMVRARDALAPIAAPGEIWAGAEALRMGVTVPVLRNMRKVAQARSIEVPLGVMAELLGREVPLQKAAATIETMLQRQVADNWFVTFGASFQSDVALGLAPGVAFDLRSQGVLSLLPAPGQAAALSANKAPVPPR